MERKQKTRPKSAQDIMQIALDRFQYFEEFYLQFIWLIVSAHMCVLVRIMEILVISEKLLFKQNMEG